VCKLSLKWLGEKYLRLFTGRKLEFSSPGTGLIFVRRDAEARLVELILASAGWIAGWRPEMIRRLSMILYGTVAALLIAGPISAHHGGAAFESTPITLKGTVEEFDFINPHCQLFFTVTDDSGKVAKWDGEFTNPGALHRRGLTKDTFKAGDQITLTGDRARNGANVIRVLKMQMPDGREITVLGPDDN
jgi:hypothetical protein